MNLETLVSKYLASTEKVLKEMQRTEGLESVAEGRVDTIMSYIRAYFEDAKYYKAQKKFETSLISVVYCEGLLDALRLLGVVKFEWPVDTKRKR